MIAITGATGQLGRLVIQALLQSVPANQIIAAVRSPAKAQDLAALGVQVRQADYTQPDTLRAAFAGVDKLLLISSSEVGQRFAQHSAVIDAAKAAGVKLIAYTSILRADTSALGLAAEHKETEAALQASGVPFVLLRNGWYTENYAGVVATAVQYGAVMGAPEKAALLQPHARTTPLPPPPCWSKTAKPAKSMSWRATQRSRWQNLRLKSPNNLANL